MNNDMEALELVQEHMARAKHRFSLAALACLRQAHDAAEQVRKALDEIDGARAALQRVFQAAQDAQTVSEVSEAHPEDSRAFESEETHEAGEFEA
jgi:hypothetical protein